ncbi:MAG TPA: hypothetical protein VG871_21275 [Vicinamibacterales bacterium]|nr:hypothetical protein [Vicinamibacterales bacterium]
MKAFIKWTAITAAAITGASFAYALVLAARRRLDDALARAEQVTEDASRVLAGAQETLAQTERTVRHLRNAVS